MECGWAVADALRAAAARIDRLDARLLIEEVCGLSHAALIARPQHPLDAAQVARLEALVARRAAGEPLAYLVGWAEFCGLRLKVSPAVLVPRPETELLVERALACLDPAAARSVLDLGTGSGAIPLALKHARPGWTLYAADLSAEALDIARGNAAQCGLDVHFVQSDWYGNLPPALAVDCVVSNPPYIAAGDAHLSGDGLRFEPAMALTDFADGLSALRQIVAGAGRVLKAGGYLLMEHGYDQAAAVRALLDQSGFDEIQSWRDLAGIERVSGGRLNTGA